MALSGMKRKGEGVLGAVILSEMKREGEEVDEMMTRGASSETKKEETAALEEEDEALLSSITMRMVVSLRAKFLSWFPPVVSEQ